MPWETLGREGRRHVVTYVRPEPMPDRPAEVQGVKRPELSIVTVMGEPAKATPISIFVGLDSAPTATERVELALKEMDRTDAWSRELIMLVSPTGTGYVNYVAVACVQYMTQGDVATVTLQYSKRPSPLSLGKIGQAKEQNRLLWLKILERVRDDAAGGPAEGRRVRRVARRAHEPVRVRGLGDPRPAGARHRPRAVDRHAGEQPVAASSSSAATGPTSTAASSRSSTTTSSSSPSATTPRSTRTTCCSATTTTA